MKENDLEKVVAVHTNTLPRQRHSKEWLSCTLLSSIKLLADMRIAMRNSKYFWIGVILIVSGNVYAIEADHLKEAMKIYDVSMGGFTHSQAAQYAQLFSQIDEETDLDVVANTIYTVMTSSEFRVAYSKIIAETFTKEECKRLASILIDPVLEKYRSAKPEYSQKIMLLAQEMLISKLDENQLTK